MVHQVNDAAGPDQWFKNLPVITRYWFGLALLVTISGNLQIVNPWKFLFDFRAIKNDFEIWRVLTCFCYAGPFEFPTLITLYLLFTFSQQYEKGGPFNTGAGGGTADYAFAMLFATVTMLVSFPFVKTMIPLSAIFTKNLIYFVLYIWSKRHPTHQANIWGIPIQGMYLPFAYAALTVFMGGRIYDLCHGMAIGHIYYFLVDVVPQVYGKDVMHTPQFLIDQFGVGEYTAAPAVPAAAAPAAGGGGFPGRRPGGGGNDDAPAARPGGHNWGGGGQRLGAN